MKFAPFLFLIALSARADPVVVVSDAGWKASTQEEKGWNGVEFDDSGWADAVRVEGPAGNGDHYTVRNSFSFESKAGWLWYGTGDDCWFRGTFEAPAGFRRAEMIYQVDDLGEVWLNGEIADVNTTKQFGHRGSACVLDMLPWVREGKNVIAVHAHNMGGPMGFAAEIRIDGPNFLPPGPRATQPLTPEQVEAVKDFAKRLDAEDESIRAAAEQALLVMARRDGKGVIDLAAETVAAASVEARARAAHLKEVLYEPLWEPQGGDDERWAFAPWTPSQMGEILAGNEGQQWCLLRMLVAARTRADSDSAATLETLNGLAADLDPERSERAVRIIGGIELAPALETLRKVLKEHPMSRAGTFAAAALARVGNADDIPALQEAGKCGARPTERAAAAAIRILRK